jgi:hypothetical protein
LFIVEETQEEFIPETKEAQPLTAP